MKLYMIVGSVVAFLFIGLGGCGIGNDMEVGTEAILERVILERGHGSAWGTQLYVDVGCEKIYHANFISYVSASGELVSCQDIPITQEQWDRIQTCVFQLLPSLEVKKDSGVLVRMFRSWMRKTSVQDGGAFWNLTLVWQEEQESRTVEYVWPADGQARELESLLESMLQGEDSAKK